MIVKQYAVAQAVSNSDMNFFQTIIVLLNAVLFAIPLIEMFLRDVIVFLGGMMFKPVYSGEEETAPIDDPRTFTAEPSPAMILKDDLVYTETNMRGTSGNVPTERESLLEQENLDRQRAHEQEIANYQQELQRLKYEHQKELQKLKNESKSTEAHGAAAEQGQRTGVLGLW